MDERFTKKDLQKNIDTFNGYQGRIDEIRAAVKKGLINDSEARKLFQFLAGRHAQVKKTLEDLYFISITCKSLTMGAVELASQWWKVDRGVGTREGECV